MRTLIVAVLLFASGCAAEVPTPVDTSDAGPRHIVPIEHRDTTAPGEQASNAPPDTDAGSPDAKLMLVETPIVAPILPLPTTPVVDSGAPMPTLEETFMTPSGHEGQCCVCVANATMPGFPVPVPYCCGQWVREIVSGSGQCTLYSESGRVGDSVWVSL